MLRITQGGQGKGPRMPSNPKQAFEMLDKSYFDEDFDPVKNLLVSYSINTAHCATGFVVARSAAQDPSSTDVPEIWHTQNLLSRH